jgi:hypothetical protein
MNLQYLHFQAFNPEKEMPANVIKTAHILSLDALRYKIACVRNIRTGRYYTVTMSARLKLPGHASCS